LAAGSGTGVTVYDSLSVIDNSGFHRSSISRTPNSHMSVMAAADLLNLIMNIRGFYWHRIIVIFAFGVGIVLLSSLPEPFPGEKPNYEAELYYGVANSLKRRGWHGEAVVNFHQALRLDHDYAEAHYNLGHIYYLQGKFDLTIAHWTEAVKLRPDSLILRRDLAWILEQTYTGEESRR